MDGSLFEPLLGVEFPWCANHATPSPRGDLFLVGGDDQTPLLRSLSDGTAVASLVGHSDFVFSTAWHPDGNLVATGAQDASCRVWDVRMTGRGALHLIDAGMGSVRSIRFSPDGEYMAVAEPVDLVHVFSVKDGFKVANLIDFFAEIQGISFSPHDGGQLLYLSLTNMEWGGIMTFERNVDNYRGFM